MPFPATKEKLISNKHTYDQLSTYCYCCACSKMVSTCGSSSFKYMHYQLFSFTTYKEAVKTSTSAAMKPFRWLLESVAMCIYSGLVRRLCASSGTNAINILAVWPRIYVWSRRIVRVCVNIFTYTVPVVLGGTTRVLYSPFWWWWFLLHYHIEER